MAAVPGGRQPSGQLAGDSAWDPAEASAPSAADRGEPSSVVAAEGGLPDVHDSVQRFALPFPDQAQTSDTVPVGGGPVGPGGRPGGTNRSADAPVQRTPAPAAPRTVPASGGAVLSVVRTTELAGLPPVRRLSPVAPSPEALPGSVSAAPVQRVAARGSAPGLGSSTARQPGGDPDHPTVSRFPRTGVGSAFRAAGPSAWQLGGHRTGPGAAARTTPTSAGSTGSLAVSLGLAAPDADGSVVFPAPTAAEPTQEPSEQAATPSEVQAEATAPVASSAPEAAIEPAPNPAPALGGDLDALALRLYPRISRQLRLELTRERDRLGSLTDLRY